MIMRNAALPLKPSSTSKCSFPLDVRSTRAASSVRPKRDASFIETAPYSWAEIRPISLGALGTIRVSDHCSSKLQIPTRSGTKSAKAARGTRRRPKSCLRICIFLLAHPQPRHVSPRSMSWFTEKGCEQSQNPTVDTKQRSLNGY